MPGIDGQRFNKAWNLDAPRWAKLLRAACERSTQREVAELLGKSTGYVSRILYNSYAGSMAEAEKLVLSRFAADKILCPIWNSEIGLRACMRNRRRSTPPRNQFHHAYDRTCPQCVHNTDRGDAA